MFEARIVKRRRDFVVDVALRDEENSAIGLFGASGAGKSTVLSCIAGFEQPDDGFARIGDLQLFPPSLPLYARPIGYMTQDANLFPHLSVAENVRFSMNGAARDRDWLAELRERLQLGPLWDASASRLSGGQARRVALARMLARRPALALLDEPFAGLDGHVVRGLIDDLRKWQQQLGFSMIVVDHQPAVLERLCPRAIVIEAGQIVQNGSWEELRKLPATPLLAQLLAPL
ncbi:MAG TPA: ATP-binding cassette domain-containing protein [Candidatus Baltobacteraceae bacterium]